MKREYLPVSLFICLLAFMTLLFIDPVGAQSPSTGPAAGPSSYRLIGTVRGEKFTGAVFVDSDGVQTVSRIHDQLPDGSRIIKVKSESIVLKRTDGSMYELFIAHDTIDAAPSPVPARTAPKPFQLNVPPDTPRESGTFEADPENSLPEERTNAAPEEHPGQDVPAPEPQSSITPGGSGNGASDSPPGDSAPDMQPTSVPDAPSNKQE